MADSRPNVLFVMTDQQRFDTIAGLGNTHIHTPNLDRLVRRGVSFPNAYSTCPVCVPARYTVRTGCEPSRTGYFSNGRSQSVGQGTTMRERCGAYLPQTMRELGYRTWGVGKFHAQPWDEDLGYDVQLHSEELYRTPEQRRGDAYARFIADQHPEHDWVDMLHGERTEMYYVPQMSPLPAALTVESWAADRAVEQLQVNDDRPFFGMLSFIGPHPPLAPPQPFNRMYDPDRMPDPQRGDPAVDHMDEQIPWMNHMIWAEDINDSWARIARARYFGEISYIDWCLGRVLDALEQRGEADNALICFFSDHGEHLGDHNAWQKESYFEVSARVPFLVSWPAKLPADVRRDELVCLTDLFAIATHAAGRVQVRDGHDVLGMLAGDVPPRERLVACYGEPGTRRSKVMVREGDWKYIFFANGGGEQLFNLRDDPHELEQRADAARGIADAMRRAAVANLARQGLSQTLTEDGADLLAFEYEARPRGRVYQFDRSRGVSGFPDHPAEVPGLPSSDAITSRPT